MYDITFYPPKFDAPAFNCSNCSVYGKHYWWRLQTAAFHDPFKSRVYLCQCDHCSFHSYWDGDSAKMIFPLISLAIFPHKDMPEEIKTDFEEARLVFNNSPKAAAALLRLAVQRLLPLVGAKESKIDKAIAELVSNGLAIEVQEALDYCRVVGNNAVHPGEINLDDSPEMAEALFQMINFIIEELISRPKKHKEKFQSLPQGARDAIKKRDSKNSN